MSRVLIVDDHPVYRDGLKTLIERQPGLEVVADVEDPIAAMQELRKSSVDLVLADLTFKRGTGLALIKSIRAEWEELPVLVISMHDEKTYAERVFRAGASGYVMKDRPWNELLAAIRRAAQSQFAYSAEITESLLKGERLDGQTGVSGLSDRELEVFELMGQGLRIREVGTRLGISHKTVESHVAAVKRKLNIEHANELVHRATLWTSLKSS